MPYRIVLNNTALPTSDIMSLQLEFDAMKADLVAIRAAYALLVAKLDLDATIVATDFASACPVAASTFTVT